MKLKLLSVLLASALFASLLCSCSKEEPEKEVEETEKIEQNEEATEEETIPSETEPSETTEEIIEEVDEFVAWNEFLPSIYDQDYDLAYSAIEEFMGVELGEPTSTFENEADGELSYVDRIDYYYDIDYVINGFSFNTLIIECTSDNEHLLQVGFYNTEIERDFAFETFFLIHDNFVDVFGNPYYIVDPQMFYGNFLLNDYSVGEGYEIILMAGSWLADSESRYEVTYCYISSEYQVVD